MIRKTVEYLLFSSIFIAICTIALCVETNLLLGLSLNSLPFYAFVFGATLVQYNFHYYIKKSANTHSERLSWSLKNKKVHKFLMLCGVVLVVTSLFSFHLRHFIFLIFLGLIAFLYSFPLLPFANKKRIKDFGVMKIATLALMWTLVTVWFPIVELNVGSLSFQLIFLRRFIFVFILCLLFDIRDIDVDSNDNINTLPVRLGIDKSYRLAYFLLFLFTLLSFIQYNQIPDRMQLFAMLFSAIVTSVVIHFSKKTKSDIYYLAIVDGMMLLQALLVIAGKVYLP